MRDKNMQVTPFWSDSEVEAHWDKVADIYVAENKKVDEAHCQRFVETMKHLNCFANMKVLNITSRDCELDDFIRKVEPTAQITHAEISAKLMEVAANLRPQAKQVKISTYSELPFADGEFDVVVSLETLEHVAEPVKFLQELYRVSKQDAPLILSCPPHTSEFSYQVYTTLFGGHGEGPHRFPRSKEVKSMLTQSDWVLQKHYGTVLLPVGPLFLQRFAEKLLQTLPKLLGEWGIRQFYIAKRK